jgi:aminopeptidase N
MEEMQAQRREGSEQQVPDLLIQACTGVLQALKKDPAMDLAMVAHLLTLPAEGFLIERAGVADVDAIHEVRDRVANAIAAALQAEFADLYERHAQQGEFAADAAAMAQRALRNCALAYLVRTGSEEWLDRCQQQFRSANNMTDKMAALRALAYSKAEKGIIYAEQALEEFYEQWQHEALVVDQWFITQALRPHADTLDKVKRLLSHKAFSLKNPNKVRSLIGAFCGQNHVNFHKLDGSGYEFLADRVLELDALNPQVAARLLTPLTRWKKYCSERQALIQAQLQRIKSAGDLSRDVFEVVEKSTV